MEIKIGTIKSMGIYQRNYIRVQCPICKCERWQQLRIYKVQILPGKCKPCNNPRHANKRDRQEYILIKLSKGDFFYPMTQQKGYIREHRLVMSKHLGRCLRRWEIVHHKGVKYPPNSVENKQDNRIENLELTNTNNHDQITQLENRITYLESILRSCGAKF